MTSPRAGEPRDGDDGGAGPSSWPTARRRQLRIFRRHQCFPDPTRPSKRIHPSADCPHGTEGGYTNWGCECAIVPGTKNTPGCEPVGVAAANARKAARKKNTAVTTELPAAIKTPPGPPATPRGRHRRTR